MAADIASISQELGRWLKSRPGVSDLHVTLPPPRPSGLRGRLPKPPFLARDPQPNFELHFTFRGQPRVFRYILEQPDDTDVILSTLRVHSNGELLVRVPNEYGQLLPNDIYYGNRSVAAPGLGDPSPIPRNKR